MAIAGIDAGICKNSEVPKDYERANHFDLELVFGYK